MKKHFRIPLLLIIVLLLVSLCGCSRFETPEGNIVGIDHTISGDIISYGLSPNSMELTYNDVTYTYGISHDEDSVSYTIYYPNGGIYYETRGGIGTSGWSGDLSAYTSGEELVEFLSHYYYIMEYGPNFGHYLMLVVCMVVGCFNLFLPEAAWYLAHMFRSWQYESVEPSEAGITWTRVGGGVIIAMGVIAFFMNWS